MVALNTPEPRKQFIESLSEKEKKEGIFLVFDNEFGRLDMFGSEKPPTLKDFGRAIMPPISQRRKGKR